MKTVHTILVFVLLLTIIALVVDVILLVEGVRGLVDKTSAVIGALPAEMDATRAAVMGEVIALHRDTMALVNAQATGTRADLNAQLTGLRTDAMARVDVLGKQADTRLGEALQKADTRLGEATGAIVGLRKDLQPTLAASADLETDAKDSWDDLYWDIKASVESGTVTMHSMALASEEVARAAPTMSQSAADVAVDVKREADEITKPKRWYEKILGPVYTVGRLVAAFL